MLSAKSLLAAAALSALGLSEASAQNLYITTDRTIALGNPVNGTYGEIRIGQNATFDPFSNVNVDITGGTANFIGAFNNSTVNISAGNFGSPPSPFGSFSVLYAYSGSTVNVSDGILNGYIGVGAFFDNGAVSTLNISGGTITTLIEVSGASNLNITGGTILSNFMPGAGGQISNYGSGTVNVTGGSVGSLLNIGFFSGGTINFGGTATASFIGAWDGTANISGGTIGSGGVSTVSGFGTPGGVANFIGSDLTVNQVSSGAFFDEGNFANLIVSQYTITGTLASGNTVNTTVQAGTTYTNDGSTATFNPADFAPDIFVTTDQTVNAIYNNVYVGIDETFSIPSDPTATIAAGTDTAFLETHNQSITNMTGGAARFVTVLDQSQFNMSGGAVPGLYGGGLFNASGTTVNVSGGAVAGLFSRGTATISGGTFESVSLGGTGTLNVLGTGLSATPDGPVGPFWSDGGYGSGTNYISAANFQVVGTLADGTTFDHAILAAGATGTTTQQTLVGPQIAPDLFLTDDTTISDVYNSVVIGTNADSSINTNATVTFAAGTDVGSFRVNTLSTLNIQGGVVHGTSTTLNQLNISGGTVGRVFAFGDVTVTGGTTSYIAPARGLLMTAGTLGTLDTYGGAQVRVEGGNINQMLLYGGSRTNPTNVVITGGTIGTIDNRGFGLNVITILGGSVTQMWGNGGTANIYGGTFASDAFVNYRSNLTLFDIFGTDLAYSNAELGTYTDQYDTVYNGVWWTVTGTLDSGAILNTRYFERDGSLIAPTSLVFNFIPCLADFNNDRVLNSDDLSDFISGYFDSPADPRCDFNGDTVINADDLGDFITAYFDGCP